MCRGGEMCDVFEALGIATRSGSPLFVRVYRILPPPLSQLPTEIRDHEKSHSAASPKSSEIFSPPNDKLELTLTIGLCIVSLSLRSIFLPFSLPFSPNFLFPRYLLDRSDPIKSIHSVSSFPPQIPLVGYSSDVQRVFGLVPFASSLVFFFSFFLQPRNFLADPADVLERVIDPGTGSRGMTRSSNKDSLIVEI